MIRFCLAVAIAAVLSGCVVPERRLSIADVRDLRIADVLVEFPPQRPGEPEKIVWPRAALAYAQLKMPAVTRPGQTGRDPAGASVPITPEQAEWDARFTALMQSPAAVAQMRGTLAEVVRNSFKKRFVDQPAGRRAVKLKVIVKALHAPGGQANFSADVVVLDGVTSRPLSEYPDLIGIRAASQAVVPATPLGIIVGLAALAVVDQIRGDPAYDAIDDASSRFSGWLLRE
jgi:hypothetical protein